MVADGLSLHVPDDDDEQPATDPTAVSADRPQRLIERQYQVEVLALADGGIELHQEGQHGGPEDDGGILHISKRHRVALLAQR